MALKILMKNINKEEIEEKTKFEFGISDWVAIQLKLSEVKGLDDELENELYDGDEDMVEYECNRYDVKYYDEKEDKNISVYVYMDESSTKIYAIDEVVQDLDVEGRYLLEETPFVELLKI